MIDNQPKTKDEVLEYVSRYSQQSQGNANTSDDTGTTVSSRIREFKRVRLEGEKPASGLDGENENAGRISTSGTQFSTRDEIGNIGSTRRDTSSYQYDRNTGSTQSPRYVDTARQTLKSTFQPFSKILRQHKREQKTKQHIKTGRVLSEAESIRLYPQLVEGILWTSENLDNFIVATTKGHDPTIEIWGDISRKEAEVLADVLTKYGKQNVRVAHYVRNFVSLFDQIKVLMIVTPRMYKTLLVYLERGISIRP